MAHEELGFIPSTPATHEDIGFIPSPPPKEAQSLAEGAWSGYKKGGLSGIGSGVGDAIRSQGEAAQREYDSTGNAVYGTPSLAIPMEAIPSALAKAIQLLNASAKARVATGGTIGAVHGAAQEAPDNTTRLKNAGIGFGVGAGLSATGEALSKAIPYGLSKFTKVSKQNVNTYLNNPELSGAGTSVIEDAHAATPAPRGVYEQHENDPGSLNRDLQDQISRALRGDKSVFERVSKPLLQRRGELLAGKTIRVDPSQFKGTSGEEELNRIANLTTRSAPVGYEPAGRPITIKPEVKATPIEEILTYGKPQTQQITPGNVDVPVLERTSSTLPGGGKSIHLKTGDPTRSPGITADVSPIERSIRRAGPVQTIEEAVTATPVRPRYEKGLPESMSLTGEQATNLKSRLQRSADFNSKQFSLGLAPENESDAIASSHIRKALEGAEPRVGPINSELSDIVGMEKATKDLFKSNPTRILNNSESIGNTPVRSVQNFLDRNAGTNFWKMADAFSAGKATSDAGPIDSFLLRNIAKKRPDLAARWLPYIANQSFRDHPSSPQDAIGQILGLQAPAPASKLKRSPGAMQRRLAE